MAVTRASTISAYEYPAPRGVVHYRSPRPRRLMLTIGWLVLATPPSVAAFAPVPETVKGGGFVAAGALLALAIALMLPEPLPVRRPTGMPVTMADQQLNLMDAQRTSRTRWLRPHVVAHIADHTAPLRHSISGPAYGTGVAQSLTTSSHATARCASVHECS